MYCVCIRAVQMHVSYFIHTNIYEFVNASQSIIYTVCLGGNVMHFICARFAAFQAMQ